MARGSRMLVAMTIAALASPARADDDVAIPDLPETESLLAQIVISSAKMVQRGAETPAVVSVISSEVIAARGYRSLAEVLRSVPGFYDIYDLVTHNVGVRGINGGAPTQGGASGAGASNGGAGAGGEAGNGSDPGGLAAYGCQVTRQNDQLLRQCVRAGTGGVNAPCFSAADCAPSLASVTANRAGRSLPNSPNQDSNCTSGTYCAERPLRKATTDTSDTEPPHVPVCVPADGCSLEDEFPCPAGTDCRCKGDTACMVVRDDGTTTCMKPGTGQQGDACPCAWNHVCSSVTQQCITICRTDPTRNDCGVQKCQASSELPENFGVCVGPLK